MVEQLIKKLATVFLVICLLAMIPVQTVHAAGWLSGFSYRKSVTFANPNASLLSSYQVKFTLNLAAGSDNGTDLYLANQALASFADIRFTAADGTTVLPYWIESIGSGVATVWVKLDTLPSFGNQTFYLYYGNASATSLSNISSTFYFSEFFNAGSLSSWVDTPFNVDGLELAHTSLDSATYFSPLYSAGITTNANCATPPFNGAGDTITNTLNLPLSDYRIDYRVRRRISDFQFNTTGNEDSDILINGVSKALSSTSCSGSHCNADSGWVASTLTLPASSITTLGLSAYAHDCVLGVTNFDNVLVRAYAASEPFVNQISAAQTAQPIPNSAPGPVTPNPSSCNDLKPGHAPNLTQAHWVSATANPGHDVIQLYFVPVIDHNNGYMISYSTQNNAEGNGVSFSWTDSSGMVPYQIQNLNKQQTWYFKVRGNNGCMPGDWSAILRMDPQPVAPSAPSKVLGAETTTSTILTSSPAPVTPTISPSPIPSPSPASVKVTPPTSPDQPTGFWSGVKNFFRHLF